MTAFPPVAVRATFRAAAVAFVPELAGAAPSVWERLEGTVNDGLAARPSGIVRQLALFLRLLDLLARLRHGRSLARLGPGQRTRLLRALERAPVLALRRGIWGLRTLVFMGYYTQPEVVAALGYRADPRGWEARR